MQRDGQPVLKDEEDFSDYIVGTVRIPNHPQWRLDGFMMSQSYFFPNEQMDDTYKQLRSTEIVDLAEHIENEASLQQGVLGRAALYAESVPAV